MHPMPRTQTMCPFDYQWNDIWNNCVVDSVEMMALATVWVGMIKQPFQYLIIRYNLTPFPYQPMCFGALPASMYVPSDTWWHDVSGPFLCCPDQMVLRQWAGQIGTILTFCVGRSIGVTQVVCLFRLGKIVIIFYYKFHLLVKNIVSWFLFVRVEDNW